MINVIIIDTLCAFFQYQEKSNCSRHCESRDTSYDDSQCRFRSPSRCSGWLRTISIVYLKKAEIIEKSTTRSLSFYTGFFKSTKSRGVDRRTQDTQTFVCEHGSRNRSRVASTVLKVNYEKIEDGVIRDNCLQKLIFKTNVPGYRFLFLADYQGID